VLTGVRLIVLAALVVLATGSGAPGAATSKVDVRVAADIASGGSAHVLVVLRRQGDAGAAAAAAPDRITAGRAVVRTLRSAATSQARVVRELRRWQLRT
jgi:hypothetical protein